MHFEGNTTVSAQKGSIYSFHSNIKAKSRGHAVL